MAMSTGSWRKWTLKLVGKDTAKNPKQTSSPIPPRDSPSRSDTIFRFLGRFPTQQPCDTSPLARTISEDPESLTSCRQRVRFHEYVREVSTYSPAEYTRASPHAKRSVLELLAIRDELDEFKLHEMMVHPMSTPYTVVYRFLGGLSSEEDIYAQQQMYVQHQQQWAHHLPQAKETLNIQAPIIFV